MIVIPMMGLSNRFRSAGYNCPKYMLEIDDESMFSWALKSFEFYFSCEDFLFVLPDNKQIEEFLSREIRRLKIGNSICCFLREPTKGQADSVLQGIEYCKKNLSNSVDLDQDLIIFNADAHRRFFRKTSFGSDSAGYLEVFEGRGDRWSFISTRDDSVVEYVTEKRRISNLCCNGLYSFNSCRFYVEMARAYNDVVAAEYGEAYVAPLYNFIIEKGYIINYKRVPANKMMDFGTPGEYEFWSKGII